MKLPERIERDYMVFRARIVHDAARIVRPKLLGSHAFRADTEDDPNIEELAAVLGISAAALLDKRKLRKRLRRVAERLSVEKQAQLSALLGRWVRAPDDGIIERWVSEQARAINAALDEWVGRAATATAFGATEEVVAATAAVAATRARIAASSAVLSLNTELLGTAAAANGLTSYRWVTEDDEVVRDNHAALHYSIQRWDSPPIGGGTKEGDEGHPGSGFGCRCIAEPVGPLVNT